MIEIFKVTNDLTNTIKQVIPDVFPMLAPQGTGLPFVTYTHTGIQSQGTKDSEYELTITYTINIITKTYIDGLQYLDAVRGALYRMSSNHYNYTVETVGATEEAFDDGYSQVLTISVEAQLA